MNTCSCLNLILACIVYWQACEISRVLSECDPLANGIDLSLLEHTAQSNGTMSCSTANISSIGSSSASAVAQKGSSLAYKITRISLVPFFRPFATQTPLRPSKGGALCSFDSGPLKVRLHPAGPNPKCLTDFARKNAYLALCSLQIQTQA